jgi:hypothetical protein
VDMLDRCHLQFAFDIISFKKVLLFPSELCFQFLYLDLQLIDLGLIGVAAICALLLDGVEQ